MAGQRGKGQIGPEDKMICKKIIAQLTTDREKLVDYKN